MLQEIPGYPFEISDVFFSLSVAVADGSAVHAPCLSSRPGGAVPVALAGSSMVRLSGLRIHKKGVPGGIILPDHIGEGCVDVLLRNLPVFLLPGLLCCPVKEGQVQQAVDDKTVILLFAHFSPCLDKSAYRLETADQVVRCQKRGYPGVLHAGQLIGCHTGKAVEKSHIVVVHIFSVPDPLQEGLYLDLPGFAEDFFFLLCLGILIRQPDFSCPEACGPVCIGSGHIKIVLTVGGREAVRKFRQVPLYLAYGKIHGAADFLTVWLRVIFQIL